MENYEQSVVRVIQKLMGRGPNPPSISRETFVNSILSKMLARGRPYRQWMSASTPVSILVNPSVHDPYQGMAAAVVRFRRLLGGDYSMERMEQADFEGSDGISGIIFSSWSVSAQEAEHGGSRSGHTPAAAPQLAKPVDTSGGMRSDFETLLTNLIVKLSEYGDGRTVLVRKPYFDAVDEIERMGPAAIPTLVNNLGRGQLIALALGRIGTKTALDALEIELRSADWRRVEAAAQGLGASRDVAAIPILEAAHRHALESGIAAVSIAFASAVAQLEKARAGEKWLKVDRSRPWQQIMMIQKMLPQLQADETKRQQAIQWCKDMIATLPELTVQIPESDFTLEDAKSRAWSVLAVTTYYLLNPSNIA